MKISEQSTLNLYKSNISNVFSNVVGSVYIEASYCEIDGLKMNNFTGSGSAAGVIIDRGTLSIRNSEFSDSNLPMLSVV